MSAISPPLDGKLIFERNGKEQNMLQERLFAEIMRAESQNRL